MFLSSKSSYIFVRWIFIRCLSLIYFLAFFSFLLEGKGLYGSDGILPIADFVSHNYPVVTATSFLDHPTLFLYCQSDLSIQLIAWVGMFFSLIALLGLISGPALTISWLLYLSIVNAGQVFMSFQWDILLLEVGFLAIFFSTWRPFDFVYWSNFKGLKGTSLVEAGRPSILIIYLYRWLLFRLMFASGIVKLGDPTWDTLTALAYHYESQPLPTPIGWFAHHLPFWFQTISTAGTLFVEILIPLLFFGGRRIRAIAALMQIVFQLMIILTGNYCFFNWLTIALCLLLLDDEHIKSLVSSMAKYVDKDLIASFKPSPMRHFYLAPITFVIALLSFHMFVVLEPLAPYLPSSTMDLVARVYPFHLVNGYGLFARMTTNRPEIVVEGSMDGQSWRAYEFKFKPGKLDKCPPIVAPIQPRLDWQMWFAALGDIYQNPWFVQFSCRLLEGSESVSQLLRYNPFPDKNHPPKYIRASLYDYKETRVSTLVKSGNWWKRSYVGQYMPPISLKTGHRISLD